MGANKGIKMGKQKFEIDELYNLEHENVRGQFRLQSTSNGMYECYSDDLNKKIRLTKAKFIAAIAKFEETETSILSGTALALGESNEMSLVRKVYRPLSTKKSAPETPEQSISEFDRMKKGWIESNIDRYNEDYREKLIAEIESIEIGAFYYSGSSHYGYNAYIVDGIFEKPHRYAKMRKEPKLKDYYFKVRQWDWDTNSWGPVAHKSEGHEYEYELEEFVKNIEFPKLSKTPDKLWEEAEKALLSGDVEKYAMDKAQSQNQGPDTQIMHVGSKEALAAVQKDLELKRNHAVAIQSTMTMIIEQKKRELERVKEKMEGMIVAFNKQIKKIMRVVTTIELYLGIEEEIVQIQEGPTADENEPICIRQGLMFMDEEVGDPWDDGQGLEWNRKGIAAFDDWLTRNENYKKVIPEKKGIAAFQARRDFKKRANHGNPFANLSKMEADMQTFLLIRNGDNLYRLITDKISFRPRLFPKRNELQKLLEYWKVADDIEQKKQDPDAWMSLDHLSEKDKERFVSFGRKDHRKVTDAKEFAEDSVFFYKMRVTLFQGLIDRATILYPLKPNNEYKLFSPDAQEKGLVRLIYDEELTLPSGRKPFWNWLMDLNSTIDYGSRIVLSHNWGFVTTVGTHREMEEYEYAQSKEVHQDRLDDRYGNGHSGAWSHIPPRPKEGMYFVKRGERWQNDPVWIDNPFWREDLITTPDERKYCPEYEVEKKPKDPTKPSMKHDDVHTCSMWISYEDQIKWFGKIIKDERGFPFQHKDGTHVYGVFKNPKKIHKYTMQPGRKWQASGKGFEGKYINELSPKFEYHDVKYHFMCIRYNPKDKVGEFKMIRSRYDYDEPTERKLNISWKIYNNDAFIINYDEIKVEDIDFYLTSRIDRRHYMHMMPLLWKVRTTLLEEQKSEVDFKRLVAGEVLKQTGFTPTNEQIDDAVEDWKKNLKWKRAIAHDDAKALRMIVKKLSK